MKARIVFFPAVLAAALFAAIQPGSAQTATLESWTPIAATAPTSVPALVPYSGEAIGANGKPLTGDVTATFLIYKDEQGGEPLFAETQTVTLDPVGHYKAQLGASLSNGIPISLFANGDARWLEVQIPDEAPQPRVLLVSVPYALKAADAATLGGMPASAFALAGTPAGASAATAGIPAITPNTATNVTTTGEPSATCPSSREAPPSLTRRSSSWAPTSALAPPHRPPRWTSMVAPPSAAR